MMSTPNEHPIVRQPPAWAVDRAREELQDVEDQEAVDRRAWDLTREAEEREDERHDEYDDPDEGGEA